MSEKLLLPDGAYTVPAIGPRVRLDQYPESSLYIEEGQLGIDSAFWGDRKLVTDIFPDPRAAHFTNIFARHQLRLLDVRQLSLPERFETRDGAGRMDRLTTLIDSARCVAHLGGTFEQVVQVLISDVPVTVGSHRLGDHLEGDYETQSKRDDDIEDYIIRSGLQQALIDAGLSDQEGHLSGSPVTLSELAQPNKPRRYDIVECPRPYSNADRDPFTWIEGLYLLPEIEIKDAPRHMIRTEVQTERGVEERIAYNDVDAARILYMLSVRHQAEHWGNAEQHLVEEIISTGDKSRLLRQLRRSPIDHLRIGESEWFRGVADDSFAGQMYRLGERVSRQMKRSNFAVQRGFIPYAGPGAYMDDTGITFRKEVNDPVKHPVMRVDKDEEGIRLTAMLPAHKHRAPIDALVATRAGLRHITEIDPRLPQFDKRLSRWLGAYLVSVRIQPSDEIDPLVFKRGIDVVNAAWHPGEGRPKSLNLPLMDTAELSQQIDRSRQWVARQAIRAT